MHSVLVDVIGMTGTALVVGSYFLLQLDRIDSRGLGYNLMNLAGAILLLVSLCFKFNLASFVIELFWIAASLVGLYRWLQTRNQPSTP
ncbi:MAG: hypothetical protein ABJK20_03615 [Halieaceae bacterium]